MKHVHTDIAPGVMASISPDAHPKTIAALQEMAALAKDQISRRKKFRKLNDQLLRRTDQVRWAPAWLFKHPELSRRCDPAWAAITDSGWIGFNRSRASDWDQYEFRRR
ncbi:MAG: hypothetical protein WC378_05335 [Opitutaceae bacterium]|jgi:hypothetical protein